MSDSKVLVTYKDADGNYQIESVWATKEGNHYRINNIPFFATNIALDDLVDIEEEDGALYFHKLVNASGHSVVQLIVFDENNVILIGKELEKLGCTWEGSHVKTLMSVDIPTEVHYNVIKSYLDEGEKHGLWSYKESCLSHEY